MGLFDDIDNEVIGAQTTNNTTKTNTAIMEKGLFDDIDNEILNKKEPTFKDSHPFVASLPEAGKQFGLRAIKSYPEFSKGLNDLTALVGDKTHLQGLSDFGRNNAQFWQDVADKIVVDDKYRGLNGLKNKETIIPTIAGEVGGQATNLLMAAGGGAAAGTAAKAASLGKIGTSAATFAGAALPNLAQEGQYLDKIEAFKNIYGRVPTPEELVQIQNVALGEKAVNTALETVSDKLLFGKLFPQGTASKGVKNILKSAGEQALTEAGTEGMQESVSIGAEKLLGINQGNNLERLGEAMVIGGITGGAIGGGATAISQPYDTQIKAPEAIQNVSAKIVDGGKVLYDSAVESLNNAGNAINNTLNAPDAFDTLTQLRNSGALSPSQVSAEEIAPNISKKKAIKQTKKNAKAERIINDSDNSSVQDTGLPNLMKENENLQNLTQEGESQIVDNDTVNETAQQIKKTKKKAKASQAVLEKPQQQIKADKKEAAKQQAIEKIKELAPNIAAKKEEKTNTQKSADFSKLQREVGVGGLIKDNEGNVYEVFDNGYIRNVDTNEHSVGSVDREYQKYEHNAKELINATPFKYNPKSKDNADNYTFSKQEAVDAYNNYIKNPTEANREIYEDTIGRLQNEYYKLEPQFKAEAETQSEKVSKATKEIAPNIAAKLEAKKELKITKSREATTELDENNNLTKNSEIDKVAQQYAEMLKQGEVREFHRNFAKALVNKDAASLKTLIAHGRGFNENSKKMFTKYTGIKLPTTIKGKIETLEKWANGEITKEEEKTFNNKNKTITFKEKELKKENGEQAIHTSAKYVTDGHIAFVKDYFNFGNKDSDFKFIEYKEDMPYNREFDKRLSDFINYKGNNKLLENPQLTKYKNKSYVLFKNGNSDIFLDKKYYDMIKDFDLYAEENESLNMIVIRNKAGENIGIVMPMRIPSEDIQAAKNIAKTIRYKKNNDVYSAGKISKEVTDDGNKLAGNGVSEKMAKNDTQHEETTSTETESKNDGNATEIRRGDDTSNDSKRGISPKDKELIEKDYKNQHELNKAIEDYINNGEYKKYPGSVRMPQEIKDWLRKYTGAGGLEKQGAEGKGLLSEYYTPKNIVDKMWELTAQYIDIKNAKVLEPSVGIGRFLENTEAKNFDVVEMNPVSARITKILYPDVNVTIGEFQERFINKENNTSVKNVKPEYDVVIGNPPYGVYSGRYKGLGEGKKFSRLETYFINRGLDTLKENGVMTFIVPSSFLDSAITPGKQEISKKCELLDAYRLPENTFDTTSIGTDIIVLRKTKGSVSEQNISLGKWFKNNPNKVLGTTETRKNRFSKEESFVKGDKNAVEQIDTSKTDIKETKATEPTAIKKAPAEKKETGKAVKKTEPKKIKGKIEYTEYVPENKATEREIELWEHTAVDGSLQGRYKSGEDISQYKGELYNDFNYLQGDIYEKLDQLEKEDISEKQKDIQRKKLQNVLPEPKTVMEISFNPTSDFIREFDSGITKEKEHYDWHTRSTKKVIEEQPLDSLYLDYVSNLSRSERGDMTYNNIYDFIKGNKIRIDYRYPSGCYGDKERAEFRKQKSTEVLSKLKNVVDKTFNEFIKTELTREQQEKLAKEWNKQFNAVYNPDYTKMPMIVKGLNSEFYGNKLELQNVQIEGVNFLTNKGVGLLGFEVGVGKTLTGIISTVQNMQMGRCHKPLILVPKQVKDNWIREINQAFPNIEVNDVGNLSKFKGEIQENTLTVATYEALGNIWYEDSIESLIDKIYGVQNDFSRHSTKRGKENAKETAAKMLGEAEKGNKKLFTIQQLGFDHITVDEAHNFKNLFNKAKADGQDGNPYVNITGGTQSTRAARLFLLAQHILNENHNRNVFMLTATPFNNSPIEVFNMMSFIGKDKLDRMGLYNVYQFMENYADISSDWIVNSNNEVEYKQIVTGFKNASSLRELIKSVMLIRSAEDAGIVRPEKFTKRVILEPSEAQLDLIAKAEEEATTGRKDDGSILKAINQSRQATLSPDIATGNFEVSPEDFVKNSPKIHYVMEAVEAMKKKDSSTSQIIYMPLGVKFLPKIRDYLVNKGVFKADEVAIIDSGVADDKISKITDSFNDKDGKIKLVIGTNKIKEGMNLNKNSSVLYVPYMDWNPTDFVQVVGRIWRRGNRYSKIRVVVPLLKNSSDSFMFQKLNEKTDRINNIMDESKEYIDTSELNTAEEKINMISNPDKKVRMFIRVEEQKLQGKKNSLEGRLEMVQSYKQRLESDERMVKYCEENVKESHNKLSTLKENQIYEKSYEYQNAVEKLESDKNNLSSAKASLKRIKNKIATLELDFEGKDSTEAIHAEIEKVAKEIEDVKKAGDKKLIEYQAAYEEERKNKKSMDELVSEFDRDTEELYGDDYEDLDVPIISSVVEKFRDYAAFQDSIKNGKAIKELCETEPLFEALKDNLADVSDYIITAMPERFASSNIYGRHYGKEKVIHLNMDAIGDNIETFAKTLMHEIEHAKQENRYRALLKKGRNFTSEEKRFIKAYQECKKVNKAKQVFWNRHKKFLYDTMERIKGLDPEQRQEIINNLSLKQREIIDKYYELYNNYKNATLEINAREAGQFYAEKIKRFNSGETGRITGIRRERDVRTGSLDGIAVNQKETRRVYGSFEESEEAGVGLSGIKKTKEQTVTDKASKATKELLDYDSIDEILPKVKNSKFKVVKRVLTPISSRLDEINPKLKYAIRRFEFNLAQTENEHASIVKPFIEKLDSMQTADYAKYDLALKNGKKEIVDALNKKYGIEKEYTAVRLLLDKIRQEALKTDLEVRMIEDYFPRKVIDAAAIIEHYSKNTFIKKFLKEIDPHNTLSNDEKLVKINSALRGTNDAIKTTSSFVKGRKVSAITKELNKYYKDSRSALIDYITGMNNTIQARKFFGKGSENLDESIGNYTKRFLDSKMISPAEEAELKEILKARFNQRGISGIISDIKNIGYITTMGNPMSTITQIGDFAFTLYKNGVWNSVQGLKQAITRQDNIAKEDIGIAKIAQEFESDSKTEKLVDKTFKLVGLDRIDRLGKETYINASYQRFKQQAERSIKDGKVQKTEFYEQLQPIFERHTSKVIKDLVNGKVSEDVKYLLFCDISDFQPISLSEMPQVYLTSGNGRIAYMLKTYSIKLLDVYRNEVFRQMNTNPKKAIGNFIRLTFYTAMLGVGADSLKDFLMGREINLGETFLDNIFKLAMLSKYQVDNFKRDGIGRTLLSNALPPTSVFDDLYKDIADKKFRTGEKPLTNIRTIRNIPFAGKLYYWWFGAGREIREKEFKAGRKADYIKSLEKQNSRLDAATTDRLTRAGYDKKTIKGIKSQAERKYSEPYRIAYKQALLNQNYKKVSNIADKMERDKVPAQLRQKIYSDALRDVYKARGLAK